MVALGLYWLYRFGADCGTLMRCSATDRRKEVSGVAKDEKPTAVPPAPPPVSGSPYVSVPIGHPSYVPPATGGNQNAPTQSGQVMEGVSGMTMELYTGKK